LLLASALWRGASVFANPFLPEYAPVLGELAWDGGLRWQMPLTTLRLEPGVEIDVTLDHKLVALGYGEAESRIVVRPLETGLYRRSHDRVIWNRPGGSNRVFSDRDRELQPPAVPATVGSGPIECYRQGPVRLFWREEEQRAWVDDSGWVLHYERGSLVRFSTPSGRVYEVTSHGRRVASICEGDRRLLSVDAGEFGMLECMTARGLLRFYITSREDGRIEAVANDGKRTLVSFTYGPAGMLAGIRRAMLPPLDLVWAWNAKAERGDSPYRLPVHLARAGGRSYGYRISDNVIYLEQRDPHAATRRLRIGVQYGRIRWVKESN
jgi:hypothetical protein